MFTTLKDIFKSGLPYVPLSKLIEELGKTKKENLDRDNELISILVIMNIIGFKDTFHYVLMRTNFYIKYKKEIRNLVYRMIVHISSSYENNYGKLIRYMFIDDLINNPKNFCNYIPFDSYKYEEYIKLLKELSEFVKEMFKENLIKNISNNDIKEKILKFHGLQ